MLREACRKDNIKLSYLLRRSAINNAEKILGKITILFRAYKDRIAHILDQLPTVKVYLNNCPQGPASAAIYVFFIADGVDITELEASIAALTTAFKSDFASLEKLAQQQRG